MKNVVKINNINFYDIKELEKLSLNELEKHIKEMDALILNNPLNHELFVYINDLYKFWISKDNDNETAYHMYLDMLNLTNHYYEAYSICKELLKRNKFQYMVYKQLTDFGYVCDGVISFDEHLDYIRKYLSICKNIQEKEELKDLLEYEENLWK